MPLFKFLNSQHIASLLNGSVRLGSHASYRHIENVEIQDVGEGQEQLVHSQPIIRQHIGSEPDPILLAMGVSMTNCSDISLPAGSISMHYKMPPAYIFCCSKGDLQPLAQRWKATYDACVEILDPDRLGKEILHGRIKLGAQQIPVRTITKQLHHGTVKYDGGLVDVSLRSIPQGYLMFRKSFQFARDQEYRFGIISDQSRNLPENIFVQLGDTKNLFREIRL